MFKVYNFNKINPNDYIELVKSSMIKPCFRLTLLHPDESFKEDITEYLQPNSGTLSISYQQGQRRSLSFTLNNSDGKFTPNVFNNGIWLNTKFKLELGLSFSNGDIVYNSAGIFVMGNPSASRSASEKTISIQCYDKFALLDGTLGGVIDVATQIDMGSNIYKSMQDMLLQDNGNGYPIDTKPIIFDSLYINENTQYAIQKSPNDSLGSLLIEMANMISCDIWYDTNGNLTVRSGILDISHINKPIIWTYDDKELEYLSNTTNYDFTTVKNRVICVGSNVNGDTVYTGTAENTNPKSPTSISIIGVKNLYLEDSNIYSEELAQQRAEYELNKISIVQNSISVESTYMIHLDVNNCIQINDEFFKYKDSTFIIQNINIPLGIDSKISIDCTNIATLPYYSTSY